MIVPTNQDASEKLIKTLRTKLYRKRVVSVEQRREWNFKQESVGSIVLNSDKLYQYFWKRKTQ